MSDIVEFLAARLNEDEAAARSATPGPWMLNDESYPEYIHDSERTDVVAGGRWGGEASVFNTTEDARHIARHDPDRVLRDVAAKRGLIERALHHAHLYDNEYGCCHEVDAIRRGECPETDVDTLPELRLLASAYNDHPDYNPAWNAPLPD